jgi:hypothetical protein
MKKYFAAIILSLFVSLIPLTIVSLPFGYFNVYHYTTNPKPGIRYTCAETNRDLGIPFTAFNVHSPGCGAPDTYIQINISGLLLNFLLIFMLFSLTKKRKKDAIISQ